MTLSEIKGGKTEMIMEKTMQIKSINENSYYIEYRVVKSKIDIQEIGEISTYGIITSLMDCIGNIIDFQQVLDISTSKEVVDNLIIKLSNNSVTPCSLKDIVDDFLLEN